jgi:hypothetical protein
MALAMGTIASMLITMGDPAEAEKTIAARVTLEELSMMQKFDLDDGDGQISRAEYILLCTVRLGALSPELITKINERFIELDTSGDGVLSVEEILEDASATASGSASDNANPNASASARASGRANDNASAGAIESTSVSTGNSARPVTGANANANAKINASAKTAVGAKSTARDGSGRKTAAAGPQVAR